MDQRDLNERSGLQQPERRLVDGRIALIGALSVKTVARHQRGDTQRVNLSAPERVVLSRDRVPRDRCVYVARGRGLQCDPSGAGQSLVLGRERSGAERREKERDIILVHGTVAGEICGQVLGAEGVEEVEKVQDVHFAAAVKVRR